MNRSLLLRIFRVAFVVAAVMVVIAAQPSSARGVCGRLIGDPLFDPFEPDQVIFVGTAVDVGDNRQNALFHVDEIWYGGPVGEWQRILSSPDGRTVWAEGPSFEAGTRYLVTARPNGSFMSADWCGGTQPYSASISELRPSTVTEPQSGERPADWNPADNGIPWLWVAIAGAAVGWVTLLLFKRRSNPDSAALPTV